MSMQHPSTQPLTCTFCQQKYDALNALVEGPEGNAICYLCIRRCTEMIRTRNAFCSFCSKPHTEVGPLVEGPNWVYICQKCIRLGAEIIEQELKRKGTPVPNPLA
jgi:ATP-dependent protease Clp ATPase subunit